ncbi:unnamed protein product [Citrullus colocynthis]|uniref:Agglutinin domain-containing protein n=1 Tax=Citrullus colocynthis TaxID=252529 RepID=A0ABP0Z6D1_9ROSI
MELPKFIGLKSNYKNKYYLRYIHEDCEVHGLLKFSSDTAVSGYAKFGVEEAKMGNGLVHIRSVYNNKYWVPWSTHHHWIAANADEPNEDISKWSCTLFEPILVNGDGSYDSPPPCPTRPLYMSLPSQSSLLLLLVCRIGKSRQIKLRHLFNL